MFRILIFLLLAFLLQNSLLAEDIHLARISTDYVPKTYDLMVDANDRGLIQAIKTRNNEKNKVKTYNIDVLGSPITLVKTLGITLVSLKCNNFRTDRGCDIEIEYPYNLTYGKFKKFNAVLKKVDGQWGLYTGDKKFTSLRLIAKKALGLLIGIKRIDLN